MENVNPKLEERIRKVQRSFIASLPDNVIKIDDYWKKLRHTVWSETVAQDLQSLVHRLAGSGGTFGFPEISLTAATLDVFLGEVLDGQETVAPEKLIILERHVSDLLCILKKALANTEEPSELPVLTTRPQRKKDLIVVIDDDELLLERIAIVLESEGFRVQAFTEPSKAISLLQEEPPALVLLDLMFPNQRWPAFEVIADLRGETGERTPVAVISGHADFSSRLKATRAGADAYLVKPINDAHLIDTVTQLIARSSRDNWRCLVIDDDKILAAQLVEWLQQSNITAQAVSSVSQSWLQVREFQPDVILLDVQMPECNGIELAAMLRQDINTAQLPIIFLTSDNTEHTRRDAMAVGADDYLIKPIEHDALINAVMARARLGKRLQNQINWVTKQAPKENAGLSRYFFFNEFERIIDEADEGSVQSALVLIGLVAVPKVLEQHGALGLAAIHEQLISRLSMAHIPTWSMLGENVVGILLPRDIPSGHKSYVADLLKKLSTKPYHINQIEVESSLCAATLHLRNAQTAASVILSQAEQMLNLALETDAGTALEGFVGTPEAVATTEHLPVSRLRIVFQPIVTIAAEGDPVSAVLARITDNDGNLLPAGKFLSALEKRGWLPELDAWVFRKAHYILTVQVDINEAQSLIIHASTLSLNSAVYLETVLSTLIEHPMRSAKQRLVIAISESAAITHRDMVNKLNHGLRNAGGGIMITNYGASANSLTILKQIKPLFVRLEESLTRRLEGESYAHEDKTLMEMTQAENSLIVASGIESARSVSGLWAKGVRWFQGYFIQEPSSALTEPPESDD
ncbi:MAG: response regulator [Moraxellaceae bacterium]|nr:response regulator [Moraxellaceae bacterium]MBK9186607.1 response regulator [Moraxellaceae bacterium]